MRNRRSLKAVIEPYRQVRLGLVLAALNLTFTLMLMGVFAYFLFDIYRVLQVYFRLDDMQRQISMAKFAWPLFVSILLSATFISLTVWFTIRYTNRVYGPLVAIHRYLDRWIDFQLPMTPIGLRRKDHLKDLAEKLNFLGSREQQIATALEHIIEGKEADVHFLGDSTLAKNIKKIEAITVASSKPQP
ncbi:MAG: hypothetical protein AB8C84_09345 [Oligoflexales bacterium]